MKGGDVVKNDNDVMEDLKDEVLSVTDGFHKEDRKYALDFLRKHVRLDSLHHEAIEFFNKKTIVFGTGSFNPTVVVVTKNPIQVDTKKLLESAFEKMGLNESNLYFATYNFVFTRRYTDERDDFFARLLSVLKPKVILSFDDIDCSEFIDVSCIPIAYSAEQLLDQNNKDTRVELNNYFKEIKGIVKDF